ncbi:MAG: PD40 domain-containing protein [Nitrosomonadales bacterium]|nr:PD40 domain-containing protein [Nitrosomonadales bacterium]
MIKPVRKSALLLTLLSLLIGSCGGGTHATVENKPLLMPVAEHFVIDGVVDLAAVGTVHEKAIDILDNFGNGAVVKTATLRYAARNDDRNLYIAFEWDDATRDSFDPAVALDNFDGIAIGFDNDGNGVLDENEDAHRLVMTNYGSAYSDLHAHLTDAIDDAVADGRGRMTYSAGEYHAEFLIPLAPDAAGEDGTLNATTRFNVLLYDHVQIPVPAGNIGYLNGGPQLGAGTVTTSWALLPHVAPGTYDQPAMPVGLTGLIAFISDHENPMGEIYTFNPATSNVVRVTNTTGLYLDGVSLSHDRSRIAFYAAPTSTDYANYEIYTVNADGTNLQQITNNALLDGHPAWSPNDGEIIYASFRAAGKASLIRMNSTTHAEILNLTPAGANDNDPDWLPDGRIVFKTDRFGTAGSPQVRIAVVNADGTALHQLTNTAGTSDHDPVATNTATVFERFTKGTDYSTDPSALYAAWNIVEARIDGSSERNLIADGWINWLPVYDPTGQYLVYLKSVGYTDARLMNKDGRDLGRLIPGITRVRYIDWK